VTGPDIADPVLSGFESALESRAQPVGLALCVSPLPLSWEGLYCSYSSREQRNQASLKCFPWLRLGTLSCGTLLDLVTLMSQVPAKTVSFSDITTGVSHVLVGVFGWPCLGLREVGGHLILLGSFFQPYFYRSSDGRGKPTVEIHLPWGPGGSCGVFRLTTVCQGGCPTSRSPSARYLWVNPC
jgi:hypothetical protein